MAERSAFFDAAKHGDAAKLSSLLVSDTSLLDYRGEGTADAVIGNSAVHWAAAKGHSDALAVLLEAGGDVAARNKGDSTPLSSAVVAGHASCVLLLLKANADPNEQDEFGDSPLSLARRAKRDDLVALLSGSSSAASAEPQPSAAATATAPSNVAECKQKGNAAFSRKEYTEAIEWYTCALSGVSDIFDSSRASSATAEAAEAIETAAALFSNRSACYAALEMFDLALDDGDRAVSLRPKWAKAYSRVGAARHGRKELKEALAAYQSALNLEPANEGAKAQIKQIKVQLRNEALEALIERGAFNKKEESAAAEDGSGASASAPTAEAAAPSAAPAPAVSTSTIRRPPKTAEQIAYKESVAAWMGAAKRGEVEQLERLLAAEPWLLLNRSEKTAESLLGNTALHWAAANGCLAAVEWLLAREGMEVSKQNHGGGTPLHSAAAHARAGVVSVLLEAGADATASDDNRDTPRDAAMRRGYRSVEALLDRGPLTPSVRWSTSSRKERPESEAAAKAAGGTEFTSTSVLGPRRAVWHYTDALLLHRESHPREAAAVDVSDGAAPHEPTEAEEAEAVLLSNRSAAHAKQYQYAAALEDAQAACSLRPRWGKAWGRAGAAHFGLGQLTEAEAAYCEGLACEPTNAQLEQGLEEVFKRREKAAE